MESQVMAAMAATAPQGGSAAQELPAITTATMAVVVAREGAAVGAATVEIMVSAPMVPAAVTAAGEEMPGSAGTAGTAGTATGMVVMVVMAVLVEMVVMAATPVLPREL